MVRDAPRATRHLTCTPAQARTPSTGTARSSTARRSPMAASVDESRNFWRRPRFDGRLKATRERRRESRARRRRRPRKSRAHRLARSRRRARKIHYIRYDATQQGDENSLHTLHHNTAGLRRGRCVGPREGPRGRRRRAAEARRGLDVDAGVARGVEEVEHGGEGGKDHVRSWCVPSGSQS